MAQLRARRVARYGWIPDLPDHRDLYFSAPVPTLRALPPRTDLRPRCPPVYDQGQLGSCTANAVAGAVQFVRRLERKRPDFVPSRLFIYFNERVLEHTVDEDSGAQLRDGMKVATKLGVCPEESRPRKPWDWPYLPERFAQRPPRPCFQEALDNQVLSYLRISQTPSQLRGCLAAGYPFVFGFTVYDSFESAQVARTGEAGMPGRGDRVVGGHAVLAVGYDDGTQRFLCRNSWGAQWGRQGYFTIPYAYLLDTDLSSDFWTVRLTE
ncbi:MAG TPA: C1 family peptidase [Myxococcaceae bacterium]|jgi:C1A family cysteine protease|nr:C1 family peptidase [Myxococcaceae bacterium]